MKVEEAFNFVLGKMSINAVYEEMFYWTNKKFKKSLPASQQLLRPYPSTNQELKGTVIKFEQINRSFKKNFEHMVKCSPLCKPIFFPLTKLRYFEYWYSNIDWNIDIPKINEKNIS